MARDQCENITSNSQGNMVRPEHCNLTRTSPGYSKTTEAQEKDLKFNFTEMIEAIKEKMNKSHKDIQENINKKIKENNKTAQNLKMEIESIMKIQSKGILEMDNVSKRAGYKDMNITIRIQEVEERI